MILTTDQRKTIFEKGQDAAALGRNMRACPYLGDETPERIYIWMSGYRNPKR